MLPASLGATSHHICTESSMFSKKKGFWIGTFT